MEQWKDIKGYEGLYRISTNGRVLALERIIYSNHTPSRKITLKQMIMSLSMNTGYHRVSLTDRDGKNKSFYVHRLMAVAFIPNPLNRNEINHKNGIRGDNTLSNIEWCTHSENIQHAVRTGLQPLNNKAVYKLSTTNDKLNIYKSIKEAGIENSIDTSSITKVCKGKQHTAGGYKWQYV